MDQIKFIKMEGIGNDYIYINCLDQEFPAHFDFKNLAIEMSHRRYGVGSDGLVLITTSQIADAKMIMYNSDGSLSEMCGNAIRCVAKYLYDQKIITDQKLTIETGSGIRELEVFLNSSQKVEFVSVNMGIPVLEPRLIPSTLEGKEVIDETFEFSNQGIIFSLRGTLISMGNPHFVTFVKDISNIDIEAWGPIIEHDLRFPNRINIEFVQVISNSFVKQRTWERGSGETWACGTGASATCVASYLLQKTNSTITIELKGGNLEISWKGKDHPVMMKGNANKVFSGTWFHKH